MVRASTEVKVGCARGGRALRGVPEDTGKGVRVGKEERGKTEEEVVNLYQSRKRRKEQRKKEMETGSETK